MVHTLVKQLIRLSVQWETSHVGFFQNENPNLQADTACCIVNLNTDRTAR